MLKCAIIKTKGVHSMFYISYGSNMNIEQMKERCPNTTVYGNGKLYGWKLVFNYHADIILTRKKSDVVPVVVWNLNDKFDMLSLDFYEGYPHYYTKKKINVIMDNGEKIKAMVYVMVDDVKGIYPPSEFYFNCIKEGYTANKINLAPLYDALDESLETKNITKYNQYNPKSGKKSFKKSGKEKATRRKN